MLFKHPYSDSVNATLSSLKQFNNHIILNVNDKKVQLFSNYACTITSNLFIVDEQGNYVYISTGYKEIMNRKVKHYVQNYESLVWKIYGWLRSDDINPLINYVMVDN
jgi:transcriptional regulator with PAS, ATPase and Fis domain